MAKRRRNPVHNSYYCPSTPGKVRYLKAAFAWKVGARRVALDGVALWVYQCDACGGWHLTSQEPHGDRSGQPIVTRRGVE